ncbi:F-box/kelch-repeat protein [Thalictrum thalictroides]|uniref:F-box/kelch-repeat protein n=1 Tax=Thalictrum thalictroides TaxID=46969 RepID=A0A7J6X031_THATH|nr:F-box/kelch-repeat protein [Thalictrum thalictroides]
MEQLTPDLTMDILSRLPIRSLLRSRCVCKFWLTITSDQAFYKLHLINQSSTHDAIFISFHHYPSGWKNLYFVEQPKSGLPVFLKKIDISFITGFQEDISFITGFQEHFLVVLGVCKGLLCLSILPPLRHVGNSYLPTVLNPIPESRNLLNTISRPIYIMNPVTGEYHQPLNFQESLFSKNPTDVKYGFGFDDSMQVFKVVVFLGSAGVDVMNEMQVYTIGVGSNNTWRREVGNVPKVLFYSIQMTLDPFVNGCLHLIATTDRIISTDNRNIIVSFHLGSEEFEVIETPESIAVTQFKIARQSFTLGVVNDCLSFVDAAHIDLVDIWLRKKENETASWIKHFSLHKDLIAPIPFQRINLINYKKNGELLLQSPYGVVVYNVQGNTTSKFVEIGGFEEPHEVDDFIVIPFDGSLISMDILH